MLSDLKAYPEGPIKIEREKTPCHAAAIYGNDKKLVLLLEDVRARHMALEK